VRLSPFARGEGEPRKKTVRDACSSVAINRARKDERIVVLDADLALSTKTIRFGNEFPKRFFDVGIAEKNMMGIAAGLATVGKIPIAATFAAFATGQAYNTIRQSIAYPGLNVKIYATHSGISVGGDGATHQMLEDLALMRALPGFVVTAPSDVTETMACVDALLNHDGPTYMRIGRESEPELFEEFEDFEIGKGVVIVDGDDVTIAGCGTLLKTALAAGRELDKQGISARVVDLHTIKPIDGDLLERCGRETGAIVTCEEHNVVGGLGSAVAEALVRRYPTPQEFIGTQDRFGESGSAEELVEKYELGVRHVVKAAKRAVARRGESVETVARRE
jgi:transketolase